MLTCANTMQMNATGTDELLRQQRRASNYSSVELFLCVIPHGFQVIRCSVVALRPQRRLQLRTARARSGIAL